MKLGVVVHMNQKALPEASQLGLGPAAHGTAPAPVNLNTQDYGKVTVPQVGLDPKPQPAPHPCLAQPALLPDP